MFSSDDRSAFLEAFGDDVPVKLNGVLVDTFRGIFRYEEVVSSPNEAEIGTNVLTLNLDEDNYGALDKGKKYTFDYKGTPYQQRGPALDGDDGFKKLQLTKA